MSFTFKVSLVDLKFSKVRHIYLLSPTTFTIATHSLNHFFFYIVFWFYTVYLARPISLMLTNHLFFKCIFHSSLPSAVSDREDRNALLRKSLPEVTCSLVDWNSKHITHC